MPLIKSKSEHAVGENIKREMSSGAPRKQAIAIALAVRRRAKKYAKGGMVESEELQSVPMPNQEDFLSDEQDDSNILSNKEDFLSQDKEQEIPMRPHAIPDDDDKGMLVAIMNRMRMKNMRKAR